MIHSEAIAQAERAVVDAAVKYVGAPSDAMVPTIYVSLERAVDALLALRAQTCPECKGTSKYCSASDDGTCPARCDAGRRVSEPRAEGEEG